MINLRAFLDKLIHNPRFLRGLIHNPRRATLKAPATISTIIVAMFDIDAIAFSIGLGSTLNDFADRLLPTQRETWAGK
jgi:hypothetical protein